MGGHPVFRNVGAASAMSSMLMTLVPFEIRLWPGQGVVCRVWRGGRETNFPNLHRPDPLGKRSVTSHFFRISRAESALASRCPRGEPYSPATIRRVRRRHL